VALSIPCDAANEKSVADAFSLIRSKLGDPEVLVYNAGVRPFPLRNILEIKAEDFENDWKVGCLGAFLAAKEVLPKMLEKKNGTILFTGATASLRSSAGFSRIAVGKFGLRALGQSLAREYGPKGIHTAHIVVDAVVDLPSTRLLVASRYEGGVIPEGALLKPEDLAEQYWNLHKQPQSSWTQELDVRPFVEKF